LPGFSATAAAHHKHHHWPAAALSGRVGTHRRSAGSSMSSSLFAGDALDIGSFVDYRAQITRSEIRTAAGLT
jgi:hypothetical protein